MSKDERPSYIEGLAATKMDLEDLGWPDPEDGSKVQVHRTKWDLRLDTTLALVVRSIIAAHPDHSTKTDQRLSAALNALLGNVGSGNRPKPDDEILLKVARAYLAVCCDMHKQYPPVLPVVRAVTYADPPRNRGDLENLNRTIARKFSQSRDFWMRRVTDDDEELRAQRIAVRRVLDALEAAGISVNRASIEADALKTS